MPLAGAPVVLGAGALVVVVPRGALDTPRGALLICPPGTYCPGRGAGAR
jgi:hypothetical protein